MILIKLFAALMVLSALGCAIQDLDPGEEAALIKRLCSNTANKIPKPEDIIVSDTPKVTYSECMSDHGYLN